MIRALTIGVPVFTSAKPTIRSRLGDFRQKAEQLSKLQGLTPRTTRLVLPPPTVNVESNPGVLRSIVESVRDLADVAGARWYCIPLDLFEARGRTELLDEAQTLILRDNRMFVNLIVATPSMISAEGARAASVFVLGLARRSINGIDNFRVGVSAACPSGTPFFPFSRHEGDELSFSIAMETTPIALRLAEEARDQKQTLGTFQARFTDALEGAMREVDTFARELSEKTGFPYLGLDGSLAPFPDGKTSVGSLVELLGASPVGSHGTIFVTSVLTDALKSALARARVPAVGFNGVMYSLLEDEGLSLANNVRALSLEKLLAYATVCGCGIDMVPVPATMFTEDVTGLFLDVAALAVRLRKPLGVRLLPIPKAAVNEHTRLNLDFVCDSRVMDPGTSSSRTIDLDPSWQYLMDGLAGEQK